MTNGPEFFNVKINVDGKVHNVKIEKGVNLQTRGFNEDEFKYRTDRWYMFGEPGSSIFKINDDDSVSQLVATDKFVGEDEGDDYGDQILKLEHCKQINMTKAQFSIFKNVADNVKEDTDGKTITLSKKDIDKAEELFRAGKFTEDISKNMPEGYTAYKSHQYLNTDNGERPPYIKAGLSLDGDTYGYDVVAFDYNSNELMDAAENSIDNIVTYGCHPDDGVWHTYTDKKNAYHYVNGAYEYIKYTENGKHVEITDGYKTVFYKNEQGTDIREEYEDDILLSYNEEGEDFSLTKFYDNGKLKREYRKTNDAIIQISYNSDEKVNKIEAVKDGYYHVYDVKNDKLTVTKDGYVFTDNNKLTVNGGKKVLEKQGDKTTHYIDGMTMEEYIMKDLRGE